MTEPHRLKRSDGCVLTVVPLHARLWRVVAAETPETAPNARPSRWLPETLLMPGAYLAADLNDWRHAKITTTALAARRVTVKE